MLVYPVNGPLRNLRPGLPLAEPRERGEYEVVDSDVHSEEANGHQ
jgi:hypothetical protein